MLKLTIVVVVIYILSLLSLIHAQAQPTPQEKTWSFVNTMINTYGADRLAQLLPCVVNANCTSCTSFYNCIWISGTDTVGVSASRTKDGSTIVETRNVNYCWSGVGYGVTTNNVAMQTINGEETIVSTNSGFNDFNWNQCGVRGGVAIILAVVIPVVVILIIFVVVIIVLVCCRRLRRKWSKEDRQKMVPKEDRKKNWLSRRKK